MEAAKQAPALDRALGNQRTCEYGTLRDHSTEPVHSNNRGNRTHGPIEHVPETNGLESPRALTGPWQALANGSAGRRAMSSRESEEYEGPAASKKPHRSSGGEYQEENAANYTDNAFGEVARNERATQNSQSGGTTVA